MSDPIWSSDIYILFRPDKLKEFWPSKYHSYYERINAVTRFVIYCSVLLTIFKQDPIYIMTGIIMIVLMGFFSKDQKNHKRENVAKISNPDYAEKIESKCQDPTPDNPFANPLVMGNVYKSPACPSNDAKDKINDAFFDNFIQNPYDFYNRKHSQREFYSVANTIVPNDQAGFAEWCWGNSKICKQNPSICTGREGAAGSSGNAGGTAFS